MQYDILLSDIPDTAKLPVLQRYKAKIVRLHTRRMEMAMQDNSQDKMEDEETSFFHILKMVKRRETRVIRQIIDMQANNVSGHLNVLNTFVTHLRRKYQPIEIDQTCVTRSLTCQTKYADLFQQHITTEKLLSALQSGAKHKTPIPTALAWSFISLTGTL